MGPKHTLLPCFDNQQWHTVPHASQGANLPVVRGNTFSTQNTIFHIQFCLQLYKNLGFPGGSVVRNPPASAGAMGSIPGLGRSPGEGNGNLLRYSSLGNPMDRGAWRVTIHGVTKSQTQLSDSTTTIHKNLYVKKKILQISE